MFKSFSSTLPEGMQLKHRTLELYKVLIYNRYTMNNKNSWLRHYYYPKYFETGMYISKFKGQYYIILVY